MPTVPVTCAGWRIEPPVSVPSASGASKAATAAAEPPEEPPGTLVRSQGLRDGPYPEFSVEEPIANSSMFALPMRTASAPRSRWVTVDSYGGTQPSRIFDPHVVGIPMVVNRSLTATGTPASAPSGSPAARFLSTSRAWARASSVATCRNARTLSSTAAIRSRCAVAISTADASPAATAAASSAADFLISSLISPASLLDQDPRDLEPLEFDRGRAGQRLLRAQARNRLVGPVHVDHPSRVRGRRDAVRGALLHLRDRRDDLVELRGKVVKLFVAEREPGQPRQVSDLVAGYWHDLHPRADEVAPGKRLTRW